MTDDTTWEAVSQPQEPRRASSAKWRSSGAWILVAFLVGWQLYVTGPDAVADASTLIKFGARKPSFGFAQAPWRLVASMFLHGGWVHLICNAVLIWLWGTILCRLVGNIAFLAVFLVTGVWGSLLSDIYGPEAVALGASGGASGLVLMVLGLSIFQAKNPRWCGESKSWFQSSLAAVVLNLFLAYGLTGGSIGRLDHWAHSGGAIAGLILAGFSSRDMSHRNRFLWLGLVMLCVTSGAIIASRDISPFG